MTVSDEFQDYVLQQLDGLGTIIPKKMFGGVGLYHRGLFFGILYDNVLYLKVDATNRDDYEQAGMAPFKPYKNRPATLQYYEAPSEVLENPTQLKVWARKAIEVASNASKGKGRKRR